VRPEGGGWIQARSYGVVNLGRATVRSGLARGCVSRPIAEQICVMAPSLCKARLVTAALYHRSRRMG
jgi:hypothetical protein